MSKAVTSSTQRKPTIRTVAAAAGVSTATVSRVMSGAETVKPELAQRVRQIAQQLGYRPSEAARGLARGAVRNIGVLMPDLSNAYFHDIVKSMHDTASESGYRMLTADHATGPDHEFETVVDLMGHVDGLALLSSRIDLTRLRELARMDTPVVLINRVELGIDLPMVGVDSFNATLEICAHLSKLGHRRIVYLSGSDLAWQDRERWRGIETSSRVLGIQATRVESDGTIETSYDAVDEALRHTPTAIVCFNDLSAVGALSRLRELGITVPHDISVTGFDDIAIGRHIDPSLTTANSPRVELGRVGWSLLHDSLQGRRSTENSILLPAPLITRASTGPAPGAA
ncbi:LacI family DNA-binding transcriptional regulator [Saccharopolyspora erythraea]|uniref:LacI family DNA-binding transcriptional regulator n=1 Tax=Saccharopolyspora erythraea TaxID=1836 RepID=UPI001BABECA8|nr:LacI family DNA-binding transcriptional regulator [Saccharopolyspora erythraea]QUH04195.1 LacI family DNA-binding transcriptional regulator [Saccharopolyspora erythraea]